MRVKFRFFLLLPVLFSVMGCSSSDKLSFQSDSFTFDTYYNDKYFLLDNKDVHEEIALASHAMALSTFHGGEDDYTTHADYLKQLWSDEQFEKVYISDSFYKKPETDSIAFGIASKKIEDFTLIAIAVRGGNYEAEWVSNFTIGESGNSQGFDEASDKVVAGFDDYIANNNISGHIKIWIAGYSRAAITSNMTAGKLLNRTILNVFNNHYYNYTSDDVYAYCFEPPMGVEATLEEARGELYRGIHNFLNYNDFVPLVAPYEWGFVRYGTDHYYPDRLNDIYFDVSEREKIISLYHFTYGADKFADYSVDEWKFFDVGDKAFEHNLPVKSINPSQGRFSRALINSVATQGFYDRQTYYDYLQVGLRELLAAAFGANPKIPKIKGSALIDIIFEYSFIRNLFLELENGEAEQFALDVQMLILQIFGANDENFDELQNLYIANFNFFNMFPKSFNIRKDILAQLLYRDNAMGIAIGHMPEVSYSFLSACDSRFLGERACKLNDGSYYIMHIQKPESFTLLEKNLRKKVFVYENKEMKSDCLAAEQLADGSIDIYLPKNGEYEYVSTCDFIRLSNVDPIIGETIIYDTLPLSGNL